MNLLVRIASIIGVLSMIGWVTVWALGGATTVQPPYPSYGSGEFFLPPYESDADRMGFGKTSNDDAAVLNGGWYLDWGASTNPTHPGGAEYGRTIYLNTHDTGIYCTWYKNPASQLNQVTPSLTGTVLIQRVQAHPGALWMVGNEPDSIYNGSPIQAELYAELYRYFYTTIKAADPTAKVAIGAIVQPSPLRMEYLDKVLTHYQNTYSETMPIDVWNIHFYRLNEGDCGSWGANVPPFASSSTGWVVDFTAAELLNVGKLETALRDFRQWMADRGYGDKPLIITEFGVLPPSYFSGFDNNAAAQFLTDMFNMMLTATDPTTGLPADGNRLVQMWAWYSTRDNLHGYGGNLFDSTGVLNVIGDAFVAQTSAYFIPYVDLQLIPPSTVMTTTGLTISAYLQNYGNTTASNSSAVVLLESQLSHNVVASETISLGQLQRRYAETPRLLSQTFAVSFTQQPTVTVPYTVSIQVSSDERDAVSADNIITFSVDWWIVRNLTINVAVSPQNASFTPGQITTFAVTATVKNVGQYTTDPTDAAISFTRSYGTLVFSDVQVAIPALNPAEMRTFTATFATAEIGWYTVTARILRPAGNGEIANDNTATQQVAVFRNVYLPLVLK